MDYITCAAKELIINQGFNPVKDSSGNIISDNNSVLLLSSEWGRNCLIELVNADTLDLLSIKRRYEHGINILDTNNTIQEIYHIYVFSSTPGNAVLEMFKDLQMTDYRALKFLKSIVIDIESKKVLIFSKDPASQDKIRKILDKVLTGSDYVNLKGNDFAYTGVGSERNIRENIETLLASEEYVRVKEQTRLPFSSKTPVVSMALLAVNVLVFFLMEQAGGSENTRTLINFGAKYNPAINGGEYWRLFTPMFLHIGYLHLFFNCLSLYNLRIIERIYGSPRFLFIYLFAGIAGNLGSYLFSPSLSAGASGAIFGLMGSLLYIWKVRPRAYARVFGTSVISIIIVNVIFGLTTPGIDNFAHLSGLVGGFLAALLVKLPEQTAD